MARDARLVDLARLMAARLPIRHAGTMNGGRFRWLLSPSTRVPGLASLPPRQARPLRGRFVYSFDLSAPPAVRRFPQPRVLHPYPETRSAVRYPRQEPYALRSAPTDLCGGD